MAEDTQYVQVPYAPYEHPLQHEVHDMLCDLPDDILNPLILFSYFWDDGLLASICFATNQYAIQYYNANPNILPNARIWSPITSAELQVYFGTLIYIGTLKVPRLQDFWNTKLYNETSQHMSLVRFEQIRRFFHISDPRFPISTEHWWKKLEPAHSHIQQISQELYRPATQVSIDEMMVRFHGHSQHTLKMPNKPIKHGYKILALCDHGYTYNWMYTSRTQGFANIDRVPNLTPTSSAVIQLCRPLPSMQYQFHLYMDNYFTNIPLFHHLYSSLHIAACGTLRINYIPTSLKQHFDESQTRHLPWNHLAVITTSDPHIQILRWKDNNMVKLLTSVHTGDSTIERMRRKPRNSSAYTNSARTAFTAVHPTAHRLPFQIPTAIDDYNHYMGGVDIADQYRSYYNTQRRETRNWIPLFNWLLDISIINSFLLYKLASDPETGYELTWKLPDITHSPQLAFRRELATMLLQQNPMRPKLKKIPSYFTLATEMPPPARGPMKHSPMRAANRRQCLYCRFHPTDPPMTIPRTYWACSACLVHLCLTCFGYYHLTAIHKQPGHASI